LKSIVVYTDGATKETNPGAGGYGAVILKDGSVVKELMGGYSFTTNNRQELLAVIHALEYLKREKEFKVTIYSDSQYVVNSIELKWVYGWAKKANFKNKKNEDLWREFISLHGHFELTMKWIRGHSGIKWNERADKLAGQAAYDEENHSEDLGYLESIEKDS
jgi:ribonuclease HI